MANEHIGEIWDRKWKQLDIGEFKENALEYDLWTIHHQPIIDKYAEKVGKNGIFLEAGCGMGYWCFYVSEKYGTKSIGVDIAEEIIFKLRERRTELVDFTVDDLNNSKLESDYFDMLISLGVIEHFKDSNQMMRNLHKILKHGGIGIITVPNVYSFHTITRPFLQFFGKWDVGYEKSFSPKKLKELSRENNFKIIESGILPSGEMFGLFLNNVPFLGKFFRKLSFFIENRQDTFGFISCVVVKKV
jgi:SAM-dependent methyltransferase